jgi:GT2 family glycosyltransferase
MEEAKRVSIHITATNYSGYMPACLAALDAQADQNFQTVGVDNGFSDGGGAWLRAHRPDVIIMRNFRPQPFARSENQAIAFALSRWADDLLSDRFILFLRPEVVLPPEALERMVRAFVVDPELTFAGPSLCSAHTYRTDEGEPEEIEYTDTLFSRGVGLTKTRTWKVMNDSAHKGTVFSPPLECLLVRASALQAARTGEVWLDERLGEEGSLIDLVWRLRLMGGKGEAFSTVRGWRRTSSIPRKKERLDRFVDWFSPSRSNARRRFYDRVVISAKNDFFTNRCLHSPWLLLDRIRFFCHLFIDPRLWKGLGSSLFARLREHKVRRQIIAQAKATPQDVRRWFL